AKQQSQKVVKEIARLSRQDMPLCQLLAKKGNIYLLDDVQPEAQEVASFITPAPGDVGPLTVTMLLKNTLAAARSKINRAKNNYE
ncbi:MAG: hypothetical protein ACE5GG_05445, partial [Candidatus Omnitrophota bacterium]